MTVHLTADDAGISRSVNRAIHRACTLGHVTSVSFLVNLPDFAEARDLIGPLPVRRTAHLNAVEGRPLVLGPDSPLVGSDGYFGGGAAGLIARHALSPPAKRRRIERDLAQEWAAQIALFADEFGGPVNVDSHLHLHHARFAMDALLEAVDLAGVTVADLRLAQETPLPGLSWNTLRYGYLSPGLAKWAYLRWASARRREQLSGDTRVGRMPVAACGVLTAMAVSEESLGRFLAAHGGPSEGYAEVILHPGMAGETTDAWVHRPSLARPHQSHWRARESQLAESDTWLSVDLASGDTPRSQDHRG